MFAYFGFPDAHEDDAQRAVRAGLGMLDTMLALNADRGRSSKAAVSLKVRVGIHTGLVVVGAMGSGEFRERGANVRDTPNTRPGSGNRLSPIRAVQSSHTLSCAVRD
jgi:class 3 adenylate cyclase